MTCLFHASQEAEEEGGEKCHTDVVAEAKRRQRRKQRKRRKNNYSE